MSFGNSDALLAKKAKKQYDLARTVVHGYEVTQDLLGLLRKEYLSEAMRDSALSEWVIPRIPRFSDGRGAFLINGLCYRYATLVPFESLYDGAADEIIDVSAVLSKLASMDNEPLKQDACRFIKAWETMETRRRAIEKSVAMPLSRWLQKQNLPAHMALSYLSFSKRSERSVFVAAYTSVPDDLKGALESVWRVELFRSAELSSDSPLLGDDICMETSLRKLNAHSTTNGRAAYLSKRLLEHKNKRELRTLWKCNIEDVKQRSGAPSWLWDRLWKSRSGEDFCTAVDMYKAVADLEPSVLKRPFGPVAVGVAVKIARARSKVDALEEQGCSAKCTAIGWQKRKPLSERALLIRMMEEEKERRGQVSDTRTKKRKSR